MLHVVIKNTHSKICKTVDASIPRVCVCMCAWTGTNNKKEHCVKNHTHHTMIM